MIAGIENETGSCDPDHAPFRDGLAYIGLHLVRSTNVPNSKSVYLHPLRRYERRYNISKMGWFGVVRGHSSHWK